MMKLETREKIEKLFNLYAGNASLHFPELKDTFVCPLCFKKYSGSAIDAKELSIEHVIPESLGGRLETMTCTACNTKHGSSHDAQLTNLMRAHDMVAGLTPVRSKVYIGKAEVVANVYFPSQGNEPSRSSGWVIEGVPRASKLNHPQFSSEELEAGERNIKINFNFGYKDIASRVGFIRSAYLMMFYYFGYSYIKYDIADLLRQQINDLTQATDVLKGIILLNERPIQTNAVAILWQPSELQCFMILLRLKTKVERYWAVLLPGFDVDKDIIYKRAMIREKQDVQYTTIDSNSTYICDPRFKNAPSELWQYILARNQTAI